MVHCTTYRAQLSEVCPLPTNCEVAKAYSKSSNINLLTVSALLKHKHQWFPQILMCQKIWNISALRKYYDTHDFYQISNVIG
jgi:hypothetical protein